MLPDGTVFDSSRDKEPFTFNLGMGMYMSWFPFFLSILKLFSFISEILFLKDLSVERAEVMMCRAGDQRMGQGGEDYEKG